jgi:hypothetical protein
MPVARPIACPLPVALSQPAVASLVPLALLVRKEKSPYLYYILNDIQQLLVFAISLGVGVAAILGTLRFVYDWPFKPLVLGTLLPTIVLGCFMQWGNPDLIDVIGLAWDCGGVTTGPVTVPILLSLGKYLGN